MISLWRRHSLIQRLMIHIAIVVSFAAIVTILLSYVFINQQSKSRSLQTVNELIDTVEPTLQIAAFLDDTQMAKEVSRGLIGSKLIDYVIVRNSDGNILADQVDTSSRGTGKEYIPSELTIERELVSPFEETEIVGLLVVHVDQQSIVQQIESDLFNISVPLITQTLIALFTLVALIHFQMAPKSRALMSQIQSIKPEQGEKLGYVQASEKSELGILITYINRLIERVYDSLTNERLLREQQQIQKRKYRSIFENAGSCIFIINRKGELVSKNNACKLCQITRAFFSSEPAPIQLIDVLASENHELRFFIEAVITEQTEANFEAHFPANDEHSDIWLQVNLTPIDEDSIQGVINDISEFKLEAQQAYEAASRDSLTQLANRRGFNNFLDQSLTDMGISGESLTVLLLDLDKFKQVNDTFGHQAGDEVLMIVAKRLQNAIRENDLVARLGGDEFTIILTKTELCNAERIAANIIESLNRPIALQDGNTAEIGTSIGIVHLPPGESAAPSELMHKADELLYKVKLSGRNSFRSYQFGFLEEHSEPINYS